MFIKIILSVPSDDLATAGAKPPASAITGPVQELRQEAGAKAGNPQKKCL